jgi:hypothetical protein
VPSSRRGPVVSRIWNLKLARSDVIIEKHWRGQTTRALVEVFWEAVSKAAKPEVRRPLC